MKKYRWFMLFILFLLFLVNYFDRITVLTFLPLIQKDMKLTYGQLGILASTFFFAYAVSQFYSGVLADRFGPKRIVAISIWTFTIVTSLTGIVRSFGQFIWLRIFLGVGQANEMAPSTRAIANWMPKEEQGLAVGLFSSAAAVGPAIVPITVAWLATVLIGGWRSVFFMLGGVGVVGIILLYLFLVDNPQEAFEKGRLSKEEFDYIKAGIKEIKTDSGEQYKLPLGQQLSIFCKDYSFWVYSGMMFCGLGIYWGNTSWISSFLYQQYHFSVAAMGALASLTYVPAWVAMVGAGWAVDKLFKGRIKQVMMISFIASIPVMLLIARVPRGHIGLLIFMLLLLGFFTNMQIGCMFAYPNLRYPKEACGSALGFANGIGQFGGFFAPLVAGFLVIKSAQGVSFTHVFIFFTILAIVGTIIVSFLNEKPYNYQDKIIVSKKEQITA